MHQQFNIQQLYALPTLYLCVLCLSENSDLCHLYHKLIERDHWGDKDVDGRVILRWIFRKWEGVVGTGWSWLRIGTGGGRL